MIAEPYIHLKTGVFGWAECGDKQDEWRPYADFEREKLEVLDAEMGHVGLSGSNGYFIRVTLKATYFSDDLIGYCGCDFKRDPESNRLLKRAEFLKAVCEKEGVEWLLTEKPITRHQNVNGICPACKAPCRFFPDTVQSKPGIDVVHVLAEKPKGNTSVACPTCGETHSWPACEGNVRRDEREWRSEVINALEHLLHMSDQLPRFFGNNRYQDIYSEMGRLRRRFVDDKTSP